MLTKMQLSSLSLVLLGTATSMAAPMDHRLEDIQCRCLTYSTDTRPTPCTYMESQRLDWQTANTLASDYNLKIQFASQDTISNILAIHRPLPSSVLETVDRGEVMERAEEGLMQRENKIVCGFGDEVRTLGHQDRSMEPECHFVGYVVGALMMLVASYIFAEYIWSRFFAEGGIKLNGDEKALTADFKTPSTTEGELTDTATTAERS